MHEMHVLLELHFLQGILNPLQGLVNCAIYGRHLLFRMQMAHGATSATIGERHSEDQISEQTPIMQRSYSYGS